MLVGFQNKISHQLHMFEETPLRIPTRVVFVSSKCTPKQPDDKEQPIYPIDLHPKKKNRPTTLCLTAKRVANVCIFVLGEVVVSKIVKKKITMYILLMEEIPNKHLGCIKPIVNNGRKTTNFNWFSRRISNEPSTVYPNFLIFPPIHIKASHLAFEGKGTLFSEDLAAHKSRVTGAHPTISHMKGWFTLELCRPMCS